MLEILNENVLWWYWILFGLALLGAELFSGTFLMMGLGAAAVLTGIAAAVLNTDFTTELAIWSLLSIGAVIGWYRYIFQPTLTDSGQSDYRLDTEGTVTEAITPPDRGRVVFDIPVLGNREWPVTAAVSINKGERVKIIEINGQLIEVESIK
ncbi:MAG: hypothetical protein B5M52_01180 [Helicobacteraceae bacterium 4484_230]|nr:MAG: hypothetical protein B5M52_01180 [Helicobacteraceae bacterium 4484_230]